MRKRFLSIIIVIAVGAGLTLPAASGAEPPPEDAKPVRELLVPFDDLNVLLEGPTRRVLISREQYEALLEQAKTTPDEPAPRKAAIIAASYEAHLGDERAQITGSLTIDVLEEGLHTIGLDLSRVGLRRATLDGDEGAPIGRADDGRLMLFVSGVGLHNLSLEIVAPLATDSARQELNILLPTPPATRFLIVAPGDVDVQSAAGGAAVVSRVVEETPEALPVTRIELLLARNAPLSLLMTLNSRLQRTERLVLARSVVVGEVTGAYEKLHATISLAVLHRAVDEFSFEIPEGFEITEIASDQLDTWTVRQSEGRNLLDVHLRKQTTGTVVLSISALRASPRLDDWQLPQLRPLDVIGETAVVGLLVAEHLKAESVNAEGLIPIDTAVLARALPAGVFAADPGAPTVRPVVAYYAPQAGEGGLDLAASFSRTDAELRVTSNLLLILEESGQQVRGGWAILPVEEDCFNFDSSVPEGWHVSEVTDSNGRAVQFERFGPQQAGEGAARIRVRLPSPIKAGDQRSIYFHATAEPTGWLDEWTTVEALFPVFAVLNATTDTGAIAIDARDDLDVRPVTLEQLTPLDENEKVEFGLGELAADLAYRYDEQPYVADLQVHRIAPRITARTFSFFRIEPETRTAHYEILYDVRQARTRRLSLLLPDTTPEALSITGMDGVALKGFDHAADPDNPGMRRWTVTLADARRGPIRLAVDFEQRLNQSAGEELALPMIVAADVAYQSGLVSVEGDSELDVKITGDLRQVDVGELAEAQYQPGRRLLGVFEFVGDGPELKISASRDPTRDLPPAIVQKAHLLTVISAGGESQTAARFEIRTKALFMEIELPAGAELWTITLDGEPTKPQRSGSRLLLDLPPSPSGRGQQARELAVVYQSPISQAGFFGDVEMVAPALRYQTSPDAPSQPVAMADLQWDLYVPDGYRAVDTGGSVVTNQIEVPTPAAVNLARWIYEWSGGTPGPLGGLMLGSLAKARDQARMSPEDAAMGAQSMPPPAEGREGIEAYAGIVGDRETGRHPPAPRAEENDIDEARRAQPPPPPPASKPGKTPIQLGAELLGLRSLSIDLDPSGQLITLHSLGIDPIAEVKLANQRRLDFLGWTIAMAIVLFGLARAGRGAPWKVSYIIWTAIIATFLAVLFGRSSVTHVANAAFYAAAALIPLYILAALLRWIWNKAAVAGFAPIAVPARAGITSLLLIATLMCTSGTYAADDNDDDDDDGPPVAVPEDVIIVPYDSESGTGVADAEQLLIPYDRFIELWNLAHPDEKLLEEKPPAPYALAGGAYAAVLPAETTGQSSAGDLLLTGHLEFDVYVEESVQVPLPLMSGILAKADLDGAPAKLSVAGPALHSQAKQQSMRPPAQSLLLLHVTGKGRHQLDLTVRMPLTAQGGWRIAQGVLPCAPATSLILTVPQPATDVRLGNVVDRKIYQTSRPDEQIRTALGAGGAIRIDWRPKVGRGHTDPDLKVESTAVLDVQEDGLRLVWGLGLQFPRSQRESFSLRIPKGYLVEKVTGVNVRGWRVSGDDNQNTRTLDVTLLKAARDHELIVLHLRLPSAAGGLLDEFEAPIIEVDGASLHNGTVTIRRSPTLLLRTAEVRGASRADVSQHLNQLMEEVREKTPLGIRHYETYRFATTPFVLRFAAAPVQAKVAAELQTILRIAQRQRSLESRVILNVQDRPIHRLELLVPGDLKIEEIDAPGSSEWSVQEETEDAAARSALTILYQEGRSGRTQIILRGILGETGPVESVAIPALAVSNIDRQEGDIVVQADPALSVTAQNLRGCENALLGTVLSWLRAEQRALAQLAIHHRTADYGGTIKLDIRHPEVTCDAITNVRIGDQAIEDTILLDFTIRRAGVRSVFFLLPDYLGDARISVPLLRSKTIEPVADRPGWVRVRLDLQDAVMGRLRVLIEGDRLLTAESHPVPIPIIETGVTAHQYAALESAGRDEVVVETAVGLQPLNRRAREWQAVAEILQGGPTEIYIARGGEEEPSLIFGLSRREAVRTAGARIGLAETLMVLDAQGAYRAAQSYRVDNNTEQFLEIELPEGAELWTAYVAGEPVKPVQVSGPATARNLRLPLVKTAPGDLDYEVMIKYGGALDEPGSFGSVSFPLIRTVNINVELSRARLFLPDTHSWFGFGGTMRPVTEEGEYEAGYVAYQTREVERLAKTLTDSNEYARARGAWSFENLKSEIAEQREQREQLRGYAAGEELQRQQVVQAQALQSAEQQLQRLRQEPEAAMYFDNRARLGELYEGQMNTRSSNVVQDLAGNFPVAEPVDLKERVADQEAKFDEAWLAANALQTEDRARDLSARVQMAPEQMRKGGRASDAMAGRPVAPEVAQRGVVDKLEAADAPASQPAQVESGSRGRRTHATGRQAGSGMGGGMAGSRPSAGIEVQIEQAEGESLGQAAGPFGGGGAVAMGRTLGLVSLDIELPQRGVEYRFTTPRGAVEITARAASTNMLQILRRLAMCVLGAIMILILYRLIRGREAALISNSATSICLIVIGVASLLVGIMPLAGVVILVIGIVIRTQQHLKARRARRLAATEAAA